MSAAAVVDDVGAGAGRRACDSHPKSNHRLNLAGLEGTLQHPEFPEDPPLPPRTKGALGKRRPMFLSRCERVYFALAFMRAGLWYRVDHEELADRTRYRSSRTHERAIRELVAAGLVEYAPGFPAFNAKKGVPYRTSAWIRLSPTVCMVATRDVPTEREIRAAAARRASRVDGGPHALRAYPGGQRSGSPGRSRAVDTTSRGSFRSLPSSSSVGLSLTTVSSPAGKPPCPHGSGPNCTSACCFGWYDQLE